MNQTDTSGTALHLPHGAKLHGGAFSVGKLLGQGGCGITYHGGDTNLRRQVAIKEFFPPGCTRSGNSVVTSTPAAEYATAREQFLEEARALALFSHRNIVNVLTVFEENNTAYMVMEFLKGKNLQQRVEDGGVLSEQEALAHIGQMAEALAVVHRAGFIHRDIKPANAIVCEDGRVVLIDFGLNKKLEVALSYQTRQFTHAAPVGTEGYAPPEQYLKGSIQSVATDIYALGATLYFLVTGEVPVSAPERAMGADLPAPSNLNPSVSQGVSDAIMQAMELQEKARPQSVQEFLKSLTARVQTIPPTPPIQTPVAPPATQRPAPIPSPQTVTSPTPRAPTGQPPPPQLVQCRHCSAMNPITTNQCAACRAFLLVPAPPTIWDRSPFLYHLAQVIIAIVLTLLCVLWAIISS